MFGKNSRMNPLASRKLLLIAESELNRAQLVEDVVALAADVRPLFDHVRSMNSIVSFITMWVAGLTSAQPRKTPIPERKISRLQTILNGATLIFTLWQAFSPTKPSPKNR